VAEKPTILVVEDDADCRSVLQDLLELNGYVVKTCAGAQQALDAARAAPPGLMLLDYMMPDADGEWVLQQLRKEGGALARVPVVLTTGSNEGRLIAERLGVRSLEKPFDVNRLLDLVRALVPKA
jgi:CheY-like chemotaxis protein